MQYLADGTNLDALAYAVSVAETSNCTAGSGVSKNNCFGIMTWERGYRELKVYKSHEESFEDFKELWKRGYKRFPNYAIAKKYSGSDSTDDWLRIVKASYHNNLLSLK